MFHNSVTFLSLCQQQAQTVWGGAGGHVIMSTKDAWMGGQEGTRRPDLGENF